MANAIIVNQLNAFITLLGNGSKCDLISFSFPPKSSISSTTGKTYELTLKSFSKNYIGYLVPQNALNASYSGKQYVLPMTSFDTMGTEYSWYLHTPPETGYEQWSPATYADYGGNDMRMYRNKISLWLSHGASNWSPQTVYQYNGKVFFCIGLISD